MKKKDQQQKNVKYKITHKHQQQRPRIKLNEIKYDPIAKYEGLLDNSIGV